MGDVIQLEKLSKTYGSRRGLVELDLTVSEGEVFGYLGPNGAGKSTTIRLLLDLIRPTGGRALLFGRDPREHAVDLHRRIGYLAGDFVVDPRQRVGECLTFLAALRGGVPKTRIAELATRLDLDLSARIKTLSKGNRQKVGLVQAFMHQPDLLILDEPTSGLDPLVQQTFLDLVREAKAAGQTVLMSSHIMAEVEAVADRVGIIREGRLVALDTVARLRDHAVHRFEITFTGSVDHAALAALPGISDLTVDGSTVRLALATGPDTLIQVLARHQVASLRASKPDLEELFFAYYQPTDAGSRENSHA
ncbi:ABC transporter ATP-binding protein [Micromonospora polyrhachis]|uniref:ABC-2 type transport system ATP-binding protein n=1 Tax=Micromonospora polyrhachis TaxID=1282883 RepID=A0A7W7SM69_9ACTN|nr:ABC transporter ATP-binding protein [Micromonospora polyrhachis]MBB4957353.1 ABC-2 type transport system ATP-binding protein [Micromonospora polyrhachis]